jgi:putative transposase
MKAHGLLAPVRPRCNGSSRPHDGMIRTDHPNTMWGTDGKQFWTRENGLCWFFGVIDHCNDEILGWHAAVIGNRFAALEPVHQAILKEFGSLDKGIVHDTGLFLRSDHGSQYDSRDFRAELNIWVCLIHRPLFVVLSVTVSSSVLTEHYRSRYLTYPLLFESIDEARRIIAKFIDDYNRYWILERLGYRSPLEYKNDRKQDLLKCA